MRLGVEPRGLHLRYPWKLARTSAATTADVVIVTLESDDGFVGYGEAAPVARYGESIETVQRFLKSVSPEKLTSDLESAVAHIENLMPGNFAAKSAVECALIDTAAQRKRRRTFEFLQIGFSEGAHLTSFTIGIDDPANFGAKVVDAEPFPILKMKIGGSTDAQNLRALREAAPEKWIRLDANEAWRSREEALACLERFAAADARIQFVEQPLPSNTPVADWAWLKQRSPLPIFGDESYHSAADASRAAECFHGVNVKLAKTGGLLKARDALKAARQAGLQTMLGCMIESSAGISAAAHLAGLCDYLDLDGNLLIVDDPFSGVTAERGVLSLRNAPAPYGHGAAPRAPASR